jgi:hypothetical protein
LTSPYTGVNAIAPKPIALTDNSSPNLTEGTDFALVIKTPSHRLQGLQLTLLPIYSGPNR